MPRGQLETADANINVKVPIAKPQYEHFKSQIQPQKGIILKHPKPPKIQHFGSCWLAIDSPSRKMGNLEIWSVGRHTYVQRIIK